MIRFVLLIAIVLATVADARASQCGIEWNWGAADKRVGCPLVVYMRTDDNYDPPQYLYVRRAGQEVDVTASMRSSRLPLDVTYDVECNGTPIEHEVRSETYERIELELSAEVQIGEYLYARQVSFGDVSLGMVHDAGPCESEVVPAFVCNLVECPPSDEPMEEVDEDDGGCSSGGASSWFALLFVLPISLRRRRLS